MGFQTTSYGSLVLTFSFLLIVDSVEAQYRPEVFVIAAFQTEKEKNFELNVGGGDHASIKPLYRRPYLTLGQVQGLTHLHDRQVD